MKAFKGKHVIPRRSLSFWLLLIVVATVSQSAVREADFVATAERDAALMIPVGGKITRYPQRRERRPAKMFET